MNRYDFFADRLNELWDDVQALGDEEISTALLKAIDRAVTMANTASSIVRAQGEASRKNYPE